jgi:hypothetical protein
MNISCKVERQLFRQKEIIQDKFMISVMPSVKPLPASVSVASTVKVASSLPKPKKMKRKKLRKSPRKIKNFDADDHEEKLDKLKSTGIRTKDHTLDLSRRMLQNPDLNTKLTLCELLRKAGKFIFVSLFGKRSLSKTKV